MEKRAIALISGGLDSLLAARVILDQGIAVTGVRFLHPLCSFPKKPEKHPEETPIRHLLADANFTFIDVMLGDDFQEMVRHPRFGRGSAMNPCVDCHAFMIVKAGQMMERFGASFVVTGEVLGQRPMSQHYQALSIIEKHTGLKGRLLRPLTAKNLDPTEPELDGTVDRSRLLDITGRSRHRQIGMALGYGWTDYPPSGGGCLLTDKNFSKRLSWAFERTEGPLTTDEIELLKIGRHYRLPSGTSIVIGRDEFENDRIFAVAPPGFCRIFPDNFPGPSAVIDSTDPPELATAASAIIRLSPKAPPGAVVIASLKGGDIPVAPDPSFDWAVFQRFALGAG